MFATTGKLNFTGDWRMSGSLASLPPNLLQGCIRLLPGKLIIGQRSNRVENEQRQQN